jgi:predicted naringenin-chalcone synthase
VTSTPHIQRIGTAVPAHDVHREFEDWAERRLADHRLKAVFRRMAARSGIEHRWSVLPPANGRLTDPAGYYADGVLPSTASRMRLYAEHAPALAMAAIDDLGRDETQGVTHLVVASCTGFVAPGIDQILASGLGLAGSVERTLVGFMGCYAAVAALRTAWHIVRSMPAARVLVVTVELSTLHLQASDTLEPILAMMQFGDGAAAAVVSAEPNGLALGGFFAATLPDSGELIRWTIGDQGFAMHLDGTVPARIGTALADPAFRDVVTGPGGASAVDTWAVHAGGRSILDAVENALSLDSRALAASRGVLAANGNMSSATLMFTLARILANPRAEDGRALAFGPGLAAEGFAFRSAAA